MKQNTPTDSFRLAIVSSDSIEIARREASSKLDPGPGDYARWEDLHEKVKSVLRNHGTVSWDSEPLPDFYFSGDWFHENSDGYSISSPRPITRELLRQLPVVLASHHADTILEMNGIEPPIEGLVVFATSKEVLIAWDGLDRQACEQRLRELGIKLD